MEIRFNVTGEERKKLVGEISSYLNAPTHYLGAPTFAYEVGNYHIDKEGTVTGADDTELVGVLRDAGFDSSGKIILDRHKADEPESRTYQAEISDPDCPDRMEVFGAVDDLDAYRQAMEFCTSGEIVLLELLELNDNYDVIRGVDIAAQAKIANADRLTIEVPIEGFPPTALANLRQMVDSKADLLKKALDCAELPIEPNTTGETLLFPWFTLTEPTDAAYYVQFVAALCKTAKTKKRVTAKPAATDNEKFSLRVWLISLGMVGEEYKRARALLLKNMDGNSAFRSGKNPKEVAAGE